MEHLPSIRAIENKHLQRLTGKKQRTCSRKLESLRKKLGKEKGQKITIAEYAFCEGLDPFAICSFLDIKK